MTTARSVRQAQGGGPKMRYVRNCGLLLIPILLWNGALMGRLPPAFHASEFWREIPPVLGRSENALRLLVSAWPFFLPLHIETGIQRAGLALYVAGLVAYGASWLALIASPAGPWSSSAVGFLAPAYTPAIWLVGSALIGQSSYVAVRYRWWMYLPAIAAFVAAHVAHTVVVFERRQL